MLFKAIKHDLLKDLKSTQKPTEAKGFPLRVFRILAGAQDVVVRVIRTVSGSNLSQLAIVGIQARPSSQA